MALQYGPLFTRLARRIEVELLRQNLPETDPQIVTIRNFQKIHLADFKCAITRSALAGIKEKKKNEVVMPKAGDIEKLTAFLRKESDFHYQKLKNGGFFFYILARFGQEPFMPNFGVQ